MQIIKAGDVAINAKCVQSIEIRRSIHSDGTPDTDLVFYGQTRNEDNDDWIVIMVVDMEDATNTDALLNDIFYALAKGSSIIFWIRDGKDIIECFPKTSRSSE